MTGFQSRFCRLTPKVATHNYRPSNLLIGQKDLFWEHSQIAFCFAIRNDPVNILFFLRLANKLKFILLSSLSTVNVIQSQKWSQGQIQRQEISSSSTNFLPHTPFFRSFVRVINFFFRVSFNDILNLIFVHIVFISWQVRDPKWIITLVQRMFVLSVTLDLMVSCCDQYADSIKLLVTDNNSSYSECSDIRFFNGPTMLLFQCTPPRTGKYIIMELASRSIVPASGITVSTFGTWVSFVLVFLSNVKKDSWLFHGF